MVVGTSPLVCSNLNACQNRLLSSFVQFLLSLSLALVRCKHRAELCDTSGILTGVMALNLKDRDDKGHDTIKKNGRIG